MLFLSCNSGQQPLDLAEIQKVFNVTKGGKEITTTSKMFTTMGERNFSSKTLFKESWAPIETITYGKDGKIEKTESWVSTNEKEFNGTEVKQEFDKDKRLIKRTIHNGGSVISQMQYRYDGSGNKIEALEKDKKLEYKYLNNY